MLRVFFFLGPSHWGSTSDSSQQTAPPAPPPQQGRGPGCTSWGVLPPCSVAEGPSATQFTWGPQGGLMGLGEGRKQQQRPPPPPQHPCPALRLSGLQWPTLQGHPEGPLGPPPLPFPHTPSGWEPGLLHEVGPLKTGERGFEQVKLPRIACTSDRCIFIKTLLYK